MAKHHGVKFVGLDTVRNLLENEKQLLKYAFILIEQGIATVKYCLDEKYEVANPEILTFRIGDIDKYGCKAERLKKSEDRLTVKRNGKLFLQPVWEEK